jgi:hypothetical protein
VGACVHNMYLESIVGAFDLDPDGEGDAIGKIEL